MMMKWRGRQLGRHRWMARGAAHVADTCRERCDHKSAVLTVQVCTYDRVHAAVLLDTRDADSDGTRVIMLWLRSEKLDLGHPYSKRVCRQWRVNVFRQMLKYELQLQKKDK